MSRRKSLWRLRREARERVAQPPPVPDELRKKTRKVKRWRNRHHLIPKSRGGGNYRRNLLYIDGDIHKEWHRVFGNRTLEEVIALLLRVQQAKANQTI